MPPTSQASTDKRLKVVHSSTVMHGLAMIRRILTLTARVGCDEYNHPWLDSQQLISYKALKQMRDKRKLYSLSWPEQQALFSRLPGWRKLRCIK